MIIKKPKHPNCPFCAQNGKIHVIAKTRRAYLVSAKDQQGLVIPGCYLIIPRKHIEDVRDLPRTWWMSVCRLLHRIPGVTETTAFNISMNQGREAGHREPHVQTVVKLRVEEMGQPSYEKDLVALIRLVNKTQ